jgi:uncharacterized membrane protein HdeD (DUF308 family)
MTDESLRKIRKRKRSPYELRAKDLPPPVAAQREPILRGLEHNAVYRLLRFRRVAINSMGAQSRNTKYIKEMRERYGTQRVPMFFALMGLRHDDLRDLHFTGVDAEDYFAALWGARCLGSNPANHRVGMALLVTAGMTLWALAVAVPFLPAIYGVAGLIAGFFAIATYQVNNATPYHTYKMLAGTLEMGVTPPLRFLAGKWREFLVAVIGMALIVAVIVGVVGLFMIVDPLQKALVSMVDLIDYMFSVHGPAGAALRFLTGVLIYVAAYGIGRGVKNRLLKRGAPDLELAVRRMGMLRDIWWDTEPFGEGKKQNTLFKPKK